MGFAIRAVAATDAPAVGGHKRGSSDGRREQQPRVPLIGVDAGAIPGTKPGSSARELERCGRDLEVAGRELVRRKLRAARGRLGAA